jgi:hypothetical protein
MLAFLYEKNVITHVYLENDVPHIVRRETAGSKLLFTILIIVMVCFAGLRTRMNDTATYLSAFEFQIPNSLSKIEEIDWSIGSNPGFHFYQIIIKALFTDSGYGFLFITSLLAVTSMVMFLKKYSSDFCISIFIFISFAVYAFTMAAMKQTLATAIGIWSIPLYLSGKKVQSALLILLAMTIHPYVVIYFAIFFMSKNIWDKRALMIIVAAIVAGFSFTTIVERAISVTSLIGDEYDTSFFYGSGVSRFRLLAYMIAPVLTFMNRNEIRNHGSAFDFLCINLTTLSMCFMVLASFGGANMIGRLANYFDIFTCFSIAVAFKYWGNSIRIRQIVRFVIIIAFCVFYYTYYLKYTAGFFPLNSCVYQHISFLTLLLNW